MYTVKETAEKLNMSEHTIRYYTDCDLIPTLERGENNQRLFNEKSINWLIGIQHLKACGMTIKDIKNYVSLSLQGDSTIEDRFEIYRNLQEVAKVQLEEAQKRVEFLDYKVNLYEDIMADKVSDPTNPSTW